MSITPYNNYRVSDSGGNKQPYVNSSTEFGYFGNLGSVISCYSMPTFLSTNNGIATVDASGLHILNAGIYTLKVSIDCSSTSMNVVDDAIIYFNFGTSKLPGVAYESVYGSFGGSQLNKMFSFGSNSTLYPGIIAWLTNSNTQGPNPTASKYLVNNNNQLLWGYYCNNNSTGTNGNNGPLQPGVCTTKITFIINQPTTIYFNIGCVYVNNLSTAFNLTMGNSYFTLDLISNISPNLIYTQTTALTEPWNGIASDSTCQNLVAVINDNGYGKIYRSSNYGVSWSQLSGLPSPPNVYPYWRCIASSSNGTHLATANSSPYYQGDNYIYTSTNSGTNWTKQTSAGANKLWLSIASSSDGSMLAAVDNGSNPGGYIWTSSNYGVDWTQQIASGSRKWISIASSSDGTKLAAVVNGGYIYTSTDVSHNSWYQTNSDSKSWNAIASDSTGKYLAAVVNGGGIYTSSDASHNTWNQQTSGLPVNPSWVSIASSSDGSRLAAAIYNGYIYTSSDYGANWSINNSSSGSRSWYSIASSSDGTKLAATVNGGGIYTAALTY